MPKREMEDSKVSTKDILRAAMLKFHPDKFEARILSRVREKDKEIVKEAGGIVMRHLNELSEDNR